MDEWDVGGVACGLDRVLLVWTGEDSSGGDGGSLLRFLEFEFLIMKVAISG